ncbi:MAG: sulfatase-like hydrolase/transferase, partial [Oceanospirillum sp.]|nr:sulfatase-like hydrolase/transferase [Oceanospirillum sp.]
YRVSPYEIERVLKSHPAVSDCAAVGETIDKDKVLVVLHQKGSHGPSYYTRYTPQFEQYTPVCRSVELDKCQNSEIVNAYDNTLLYTDQLLADIIDTLKEVQDSATLMMYLSDHGESLGEFGLYLHGAPYSLAPDVQKDIPFIIWPSERFIEEQGLDIEAIKAGESHSQSQVFHSILNAFDLESDAYNPELDIFNTAQ